MRLPVIWTILRKELTEAMRDRVTLIVLIGLPLVIYPLLLAATTAVTAQLIETVERKMSRVAVWGVGAQPMFDWLSSTNSKLELQRWQHIPATLRAELEGGRLHPPARTNAPMAPTQVRLGGKHFAVTSNSPATDPALRAAREVVSGRHADAVIVVWPGFDEALQQHDLGQVSVYYDSVLPQSAQAWSRLSGKLDKFRQRLVKERQRERGLPKGFVTALEIRADDVAPVQRQLNHIAGTVLPLVLVVFAVLGALVAAADLTAGEKERGTMQTLLCAPVRSFEIVAGKFLTVWCISLASALANLVGMGFLAWRLAKLMHLEVVHAGTLLAIVGLMLPATWTLAALFLAVATLARDSKDAGNFLSGTFLVLLVPMGLATLPGMELSLWTACAPLANLVLLICGLMIGPVAWHLITLTLLSSLAYAGLALALAGRIFGREQILLGGTFSWRWLLQGERQSAPTPSPGFVLALFPLAAVGLLYGSLLVFDHGVPVVLLVTQYGVLLLPTLALAWARKFSFAETFSLRWPHWRSLVGAVLIGATAGVGLTGLVMRLLPPPTEFLRQFEELLQLKSAPLWQLWLLIALTPALCEETFFRGLMLSGLRRWGPWAAVGISSLLFAIFHGSIYRLAPTFLLGLVLGYAVWRSRSLYCSMLIHLLNNGLIATLVWSAGEKGESEQLAPWGITLGALAVTAIGLALLRPPKTKSL